MKIEELEKGEHGQVSKILVDFWKDFGLNYTSTDARSFLLEGYKSEIKEDKFFVIKDKSMVGVAGFVINENGLAELRDFVIKKEKRKRGYGRQLMEYVIDYVKKKKVRKLFGLSPQESKGFYEKFGFKEEGLLKNHFKDGQNVYFMSLKLIKEKQVDLKNQLEKLTVEKDTEDTLLKLPT